MDNTVLYFLLINVKHLFQDDDDDDEADEFDDDAKNRKKDGVTFVRKYCKNTYVISSNFV